jgi:hypothetical protein
LIPKYRDFRRPATIGPAHNSQLPVNFLETSVNGSVFRYSRGTLGPFGLFAEAREAIRNIATKQQTISTDKRLFILSPPLFGFRNVGSGMLTQDVVEFSLSRGSE